ncbi:hypothetical protein G4B88_015232 [Cannabis sativa]|uniref:CCHC-type domain-containing protein n=1 Tax=Cannabis sativa TaxID=3483 RepID=A0A7J6HDK9_CANSA|nr:hypothetical protein G4B88_015232 [Cannabis sativa]
MALVNATNSSTNGKCISYEEASVKISPCASSQQALATFCLLGKVVAPMKVNEATIIDFVNKVWKFNVTVVALNEGANNFNCFELGFLSTENRSWALEHGPWSVRGYSFILKVWAPRKDLFGVFDHVKVWVHIFNLPRDYFSIVNGNTLGAKAGIVLKVDLDECNPTLWKKSLNVLISLNVNRPLFSGCYLPLDSGVQRWVQFKYGKLGIFCYNCGKLGHQRRGCSLTSPVTVSSENGVPFPLFGPWLSMDSSYKDVFSGAHSFSATSSLAAPASTGPKHGGSRPLATVPGVVGSVRRSPTSRSVSRPLMVTGRRSLGGVQGCIREWVPKVSPGSSMPNFAVLGKEFPSRTLVEEKSPAILPISISNLAEPSKKSGKGKGFCEMDVGPALSSNGPVSKVGFSNGASSRGPSNKSIVPTFSIHGTEPFLENNKSDLLLINESGPCDIFGPSGLPGLHGKNTTSCDKSTKTMSIESSTCGQEVNFLHDESLALSNFFQAQETLIHELKKFGNMDLFEIKAIGGDIGVPTASEVNERTTPFKKRKFDGASASLCSRPWKLPRHHPGVVRDFPWDSATKANATNEVEEEPTEDGSLSNSAFLGSDEWCSNVRFKCYAFIVDQVVKSIILVTTFAATKNLKTPEMGLLNAHLGNIDKNITQIKANTGASTPTPSCAKEGSVSLEKTSPGIEKTFVGPPNVLHAHLTRFSLGDLSLNLPNVSWRPSFHRMKVGKPTATATRTPTPTKLPKTTIIQQTPTTTSTPPTTTIRTNSTTFYRPFSHTLLEFNWPLLPKENATEVFKKVPKANLYLKKHCDLEIVSTLKKVNILQAKRKAEIVDGTVVDCLPLAMFLAPKLRSKNRTLASKVEEIKIQVKDFWKRVIKELN